jgi:hypothetical protein
MLWLLAWVAFGRWVFKTSNGDFIVDRRLVTMTFWRTAYPLGTISGFHVNEQSKKIKGNTSLRYRVLMASRTARARLRGSGKGSTQRRSGCTTSPSVAALSSRGAAVGQRRKR